MTSKRSRRATVLLTERALADIRGIEGYSTEQWGADVAARYVDELEAGLQRLTQRPELACGEADFHSALRFYRVNKHLLVCDVQDGAVIVLTVIHASMDVPSRLAELEPQLAAEVKLLHEQLVRASRRQKKPSE